MVLALVSTATATGPPPGTVAMRLWASRQSPTKPTVAHLARRRRCRSAETRRPHRGVADRHGGGGKGVASAHRHHRHRAVRAGDVIGLRLRYNAVRVRHNRHGRGGLGVCCAARPPSSLGRLFGDVDGCRPAGAPASTVRVVQPVKTVSSSGMFTR